MASKSHDPWYLLAAARGSVLQHKERLLDCDHDAETCTCDLAAQKIALLDRIDAALAAHEAEERVESATQVVQWKTDAFGIDYVKQGNVLSMVAQSIDGRWGWETQVAGYADTEAEAQRAALAAARGMR